jgi:Recombination endonuclease VII.
MEARTACLDMEVQTKKKCTKCGIEKRFEEFYRDAYSKLGIVGKCRDCWSHVSGSWRRKNREKIATKRRLQVVKRREALRSQHLKSKYGLTVPVWTAMVAAQSGKCRVCGKVGTGNRNSQNLFVDHCHNTLRIRGLVCHQCNLKLDSDQLAVHRLASSIRYHFEATGAHESLIKEISESLNELGKLYYAAANTPAQHSVAIQEALALCTESEREEFGVLQANLRARSDRLRARKETIADIVTALPKTDLKLSKAEIRELAENIAARYPARRK